MDAELGIGVVPLTDGASFPDFYESTYRSSLRLAVLLVGNVEQARDLIHDAYISAHRRWPSVAGYDRPDLWMRRVVLNAAASHRRRSRAEARAVGRLGGRPVEHEGDVASRALAGEVWRAVQRLPSQQARAITLVYGMDMALADAAEVLGCSVGAVKTHLARARERLAIELGAHDD